MAGLPEIEVPMMHYRLPNLPFEVGIEYRGTYVAIGRFEGMEGKPGPGGICVVAQGVQLDPQMLIELGHHLAAHPGSPCKLALGSSPRRGPSPMGQFLDEYAARVVREKAAAPPVPPAPPEESSWEFFKRVMKG